MVYKYKILFYLFLISVFNVAGQNIVSEVERSEQVMKALAMAYSGRIGPAEYRNGDWAVPIRGVYYYYAGGRLLPENLLSRAEEYGPHPFYNYPVNLPAWRAPSQEESLRLQNAAENRRQNPPKRSQIFFDELWRAHNRDESYERVKTLRFLGHNVMVHYGILSELALVEEVINAAAKTNPQVRQWLQNIASITGWNWRNIAETESRSFHAYGTAIDILPKNNNLETYWLWTARNNPQWWNVPYSRRHHPPDAVVKAFESYGFVWGGKWLFFDTIHFEYRPEVFILNKIPLRDIR